jgi:hypothetical protein
MMIAKKNGPRPVGVKNFRQADRLKKSLFERSEFGIF